MPENLDRVELLNLQKDGSPLFGSPGHDFPSKRPATSPRDEQSIQENKK